MLSEHSIQAYIHEKTDAEGMMQLHFRWPDIKCFAITI